MWNRNRHWLAAMIVSCLAWGVGLCGEDAPPLPGQGPGPVVTSPNPVVTQPGTVVVVPSGETIRPLSRRESFDDYALAWSEEFNSDKLDPAVWDFRNETKFWSTGTEENVSVSGGYLRIALKKERIGKSDYSTAMVVTKRSFRYGYYEVSVKIPPGKGWHTSLFLTAHKSEVTGSRQQIDLCENDSIDPKNFIVNLHGWKPVHRVYDTKRVKGPDLSQDFHVFGCEFSAKKVRYFQDGELVATFDADKMVHDDQSLHITCYAAPLSKTLHVDDEKLPAELLVDWVRFYEKKK